MTRSRWSDVAAVVLAIPVIGGLGFVFRAQHTHTIAAAPPAASLDRPQPPLNTHQSVLFVGDSYTAGTGVAEMSYGCMAAFKMGLLCRLSAGPGTGYISGGVANRFVVNEYIGPSKSFDERLPGLAAKYNPDIVILDGGRNDLFASTDSVFNSMSTTIAEVRRTWPQATIVLIRPRFLSRPGDDLGFDDDFIARLKQQPAAQDMVVIDPIGSLSSIDTSSLLASDGIHPNKRGELALASALVASLRDQGVRSKS